MSENSKYVTPQFKKIFNPKIGLITLSTDLTMENDFYSISKDLPLDIFVNRIKNYNPLTKENLLKMYDQLEAVTKDILPDEKINTVAYGCTSGTIVIGKDKIKEKWGINLTLDKTNRKFDFAIFNKNTKKLYLIEVNFYSGGGSKLKATAGEYKALNEFIKNNNNNVQFIWITDGKGWLTALNPLEETFNHNDYVINLYMLKLGILEYICK